MDVWLIYTIFGAALGAILMVPTLIAHDRIGEALAAACAMVLVGAVLVGGLGVLVQVNS